MQYITYVLPSPKIWFLITHTSHRIPETPSPGAALTTFSSWLPSSSSLPSRSNNFSLISCKKSREGMVRPGGWCKGSLRPLGSTGEPQRQQPSGCGVDLAWQELGLQAWLTALEAHLSQPDFGQHGIFIFCRRERVEGPVLQCRPLSLLDGECS